MKKLLVVAFLFTAAICTAQYSDEVYKNMELKGGLKLGGKTVTAISRDTTLSGKSDNSLVSEKAVKTYVDNSKIYLNVKDFGAKGDGVTDDRNAIQAALNAALLKSRSIYLPAGDYKISSPIIKNSSFQCPSIIGESSIYTMVHYTDTAFKIIGGSGQVCGGIISGLTFVGTSSSIGIDIEGQNGVTITDCAFKDNAVGVLFFNKSAGSFTEYCVVNKSYFEVNCKVVIEYKRTGGLNSFHGSGIKDCIVNSSNDYAIKIGDGCFPYNAPIDAQFWVHKTNQSLIRNENHSTNDGYSYGTITIECFANGLTVGDKSADAYTWNHSGIILGIHKFTLGSLRKIGDIDIYGPEDGNAIRFQIKGFTIHKTMSDTFFVATNVSTGIAYNGDSYMATIAINANNYRFRYLLVLNHQGFGGAGTVSVITTPFQYNTTGKATPIFSVASNGNFIVTIPSGLSGATLDASFNTFGNGGILQYDN